MIGIGYCKATSFVPGSGENVVSGRCALLSVVTHSTLFQDPHPILFKNGSSSGDLLYAARPFSTLVALGNPSQTVNQVVMGGAGILFEDGIWFEFSSTGSNPSADNIVLFHT